jgi:twinfilin-like protein
MLYASTRRVAIQLGEAEGIQIEKKVANPSYPLLSEWIPCLTMNQIEGSSPDEITGARLQEEVAPRQDEGPKRGFARPKRPGR